MKVARGASHQVLALQRRHNERPEIMALRHSKGRSMMHEPSHCAAKAADRTAATDPGVMSKFNAKIP